MWVISDCTEKWKLRKKLDEVSMRIARTLQNVKNLVCQYYFSYLER